MTPEGLNSRLTFLNQCVRPGDTIPVIGPDGSIRNDSALNTSFGTPPILVLRIGDFYHTKIVPNSLQISYDPLVYDMNPEGIGLQPMLANISMSFDFIGGHGLANPVEQLQNALSFNFYANTEVYDERATETDFSLTKLDKELFERCYSLYLDKTYHMMPEELAINKISLTQDNISRAFTCKVIYDANYNLLSYKFFKSNIKAINLTYEEADKLINQDLIIKAIHDAGLTNFFNKIEKNLNFFINDDTICPSFF